jgi:hypothetical protein
MENEDLKKIFMYKYNADYFVRQLYGTKTENELYELLDFELSTDEDGINFVKSSKGNAVRGKIWLVNESQLEKIAKIAKTQEYDVKEYKTNLGQVLIYNEIEKNDLENVDILNFQKYETHTQRFLQ